jgi:ornithine cyclodeaminase/alanine dehydrogenase-like protein (mu-crystallin family)
MAERVVTRAEIERALLGIDVVAAMERAFATYSGGRVIVPPVGELLFPDPPGDAHIKYGYVEGDEVFVVKVATGFYDNPKRGLPPNSGLMLVFDARTGMPRAVLLDQGHLTNVRTAAAGAVAAKYLAPRAVSTIAVLGGGLQARMQAVQLKAVTACRRMVLWARRRDAADTCAADLTAADYSVTIVDSPAAAAAEANLIVTATAATTPLLQAADIRPGTHITAMGSDTETKQELSAEVLAKADIVVADSIAQCLVRGEISHALAAGAIEQAALVELGDVITGKASGRTSDDQITVVDLTGVAVQDIEIAKAVLAGLD